MSSAVAVPFAVKRADPGELARHKPDAHFELIRDQGIGGRCSLWWNSLPAWNGQRLGMIGHYAASGEGGSALLDHACRQLAKRGCTLAVGPIDGSTWRPYRLITSFGDEPRFFLEPDNPPQWADHFSEAGFEPLARFFSALCDDLKWSDPRVGRSAARLAHAGVTLRPIRSEAFEEDLRRVFAVARVAFRGNLLYADPDETELLENYRPLLGKVPLDLILLAEHAGQPVGFVFAVPNLTERERGEPVRTVIVKTLAACPCRQYAGLGQLLLAEVQRRAHTLGFTRAIHALVRDTRQLRRISNRYAPPIREYTLFARMLLP